MSAFIMSIRGLILKPRSYLFRWPNRLENVSWSLVVCIFRLNYLGDIFIFICACFLFVEFSIGWACFCPVTSVPSQAICQNYTYFHTLFLICNEFQGVSVTSGILIVPVILSGPSSSVKQKCQLLLGIQQHQHDLELQCFLKNRTISNVHDICECKPVDFSCNTVA